MEKTSAPSAPDAVRVGFIGAGKVGFTLGKFFAENGVHVAGYCSQHAESAREAAAFTGSAAFETPAELLEASDAVFITVPDGAIAGVYRELCQMDIAGKQLCHCSGSLSAAETFPDARERGAYGYSLHPLFPASSKTESWKELSGAWFCVEGEGPHLEGWKRCIEAMGPTVQLIPSQAKKRYHAACVVSSNLMCALVQQSLDMLADCGFSEDGALAAIAPLVRANMAHVVESGPVAALTGPIERNDTATVAAHLGCFDSADQRELYRFASLKLIELAHRRHPDADYAAMREILAAETASH